MLVVEDVKLVTKNLLIRNRGQKSRSGFLVGGSFKTNSGSHYDDHISYARR